MWSLLQHVDLMNFCLTSTHHSNNLLLLWWAIAHFRDCVNPRPHIQRQQTIWREPISVENQTVTLYKFIHGHTLGRVACKVGIKQSIAYDILWIVIPTLPTYWGMLYLGLLAWGCIGSPFNFKVNNGSWMALEQSMGIASLSRRLVTPWLPPTIGIKWI